MGSFLEKPITEKDTDRGDGPGMTWGLSSMQGWRIEMEVRLYQRPVNRRWGTCKVYVSAVCIRRVIESRDCGCVLNQHVSAAGCVEWGSVHGSGGREG